MSIPEPVMIAARNTPAVVPELLNSERIKASFGSYGIEILNEAAGLRHANLFSLANGDKTCRTYAVVRSNDVPDALAEPHEAIQGGRSIGMTLKSYGWEVAKRTIVTAELELGAIEASVAALMRLDASGRVAVHVYELVIDNGAERIDYATILELHHPAYIDAPTLRELFPVDSTIKRDALHELLRVFGLKA